MEDTAALESRVRTLERGQRRLGLICLALAIVLVASVVWRVVWVPTEVSAHRFVLRDASGGTRGEWGPNDVAAGEVDGVTQHASATCLALRAAKKKGGSLRLCAPWDPYGGPSIAMDEETGASLHISLDAYTVSVLGRTTPSAKANRGALLLGVWQDEASIQVSEKKGRRTRLLPDGLAAYNSEGALAYQTPGSTPR